VHNTIIEGNGIFQRGEKVAIGASGGKGGSKIISILACTKLMLDSTVLAHVLSVLNKRYEYGLDLYLLSIDEGITGYRDDSLEVGQTANESTMRCLC
jgi:cytoplasmic tRNA 2-thiolation protein 1